MSGVSGSKSTGLMAAAGLAGSGGSTQVSYVEDVFKAFSYGGNGVQTTYNIDVDLLNEGGLVWIKGLSHNSGNMLFDSERQLNIPLQTQSAGVQGTTGLANSMDAFTSTGFVLGNDQYTDLVNGTNNVDYSCNVFRKAPRFFDIVTYTGDDTADRQINHSLGVAPGFVIVRPIEDAGGVFENYWNTRHKDGGYLAQYALGGYLNTNSSVGNTLGLGEGNASHIIVGQAGSTTRTNKAGIDYIAYIFADDPDGPNGNDGLIKCGSFTTDANANANVTIGWQPQWILVKCASNTGDWYIMNTSGYWCYDGYRYTSANTNSVETAKITGFYPTTKGFKLKGLNPTYFPANETFIYVAIREGNMRPVTTSSDFFKVEANSFSASPFLANDPPQNSAPYKIDTTLTGLRSGTDTSLNFTVFDKFLGIQETLSDVLITNNYNITGSTKGYLRTLYNYSFNNNAPVSHYTHSNYLPAGGTNKVSYIFKDTVGAFGKTFWLGESSGSQTVPHNLGATPELIIAKRLQDGGSYGTADIVVYHKDISPSNYLYLNRDWSMSALAASSSPSNFWGATADSNNIYPGWNMTANGGGAASEYVAWLWTSMPGIVDIGSYVGNDTGINTAQTIDCGLASSPKFVLVKNASSTGSWYVFDVERGFTSSTSPALTLDTTAAEDDSEDPIDPTSTGFFVIQKNAIKLNTNGDTYIYMAIAS